MQDEILTIWDRLHQRILRSPKIYCILYPKRTVVTKAQILPTANFSQINQKNYKPNVLHIKHYIFYIYHVNIH